VDAIREYLKEYKTTWSGINGEIVIGIINHCDEHRQAAAATAKRAAKREKFVIPTPEQVGAYFKEIGYGVDPQSWCDFYEARGWHCGKAPMLSWKAACRQAKTNGWQFGKPMPGGGYAPSRPSNASPYAEPVFDWRRAIATKWPRDENPDRPAFEERDHWTDVPLTIRTELLQSL